MIRACKHFVELQHLHGTNAFKVCESEMMISRGLFVKNYKDYLFYHEIVSKQQR